MTPSEDGPPPDLTWTAAEHGRRIVAPAPQWGGDRTRVRDAIDASEFRVRDDEADHRLIAGCLPRDGASSRHALPADCPARKLHNCAAQSRRRGDRERLRTARRRSSGQTALQVSAVATAPARRHRVVRGTSTGIGAQRRRPASGPSVDELPDDRSYIPGHRDRPGRRHRFATTGVVHFADASALLVDREVERLLRAPVGVVLTFHVTGNAASSWYSDPVVHRPRTDHLRIAFGLGPTR